MGNVFFMAVSIAKSLMCEHGPPYILKKIVTTGLGENMWNLALQPLKTSYIQYHNANSRKTVQGGDLPLHINSHDSLITWSCEIT